LLAVLCLSCDRGAIGPSACDGLADKLVGITRADYATCAGEILAALEELEQLLGRMTLEGESDARPQAEATYKRLRHLMREVDLQGDIRREVRAESHAPEIERWPDGSMRSKRWQAAFELVGFSMLDGIWNGERLLPEGFVRFVATPAPAWEEPVDGGSFWINGTGRYPLPREAFYMSGNGGQRVFVVPSHDLVIVRMGHTRGGATADTNLRAAQSLILEAVEVLKNSG
jgi:hypothetical protein